MVRQLSIALVAPGQGSQQHGMFESLLETWPVARHTLDECEATVKLPLRTLASSTGSRDIDRTDITQPLLVAHTAMVVRTLQQRFGQEAAWTMSAGHSVGEIGAMLASGCLTVEEAMSLAAIRGRAMRAAQHRWKRPALMTVLLGCSVQTLLEAVPELATASNIAGVDGVVAIASVNGSAQVALSGDHDAVDAAVERALEAGAARRRKDMPTEVAFHSPVMLAARGALTDMLLGRKEAETATGMSADDLDTMAALVGWSSTERIPLAVDVIPRHSMLLTCGDVRLHKPVAKAEQQEGDASVVQSFLQQTDSTVRWEECVASMLTIAQASRGEKEGAQDDDDDDDDEGGVLVVLEAGPGSTLTSLARRQGGPRVQGLPCGSAKGVDDACRVLERVLT